MRSHDSSKYRLLLCSSINQTHISDGSNVSSVRSELNRYISDHVGQFYHTED